MKWLLGILYTLLFVLVVVLAVLAGLMYLEKEKPQVYNQVLKTLNEMIQTKEDPLKGSNDNLNVKKNNNSAIENSQQTDVSQEDAIDIPITENTRNSISQKELQAVQRTDMIPVKGIGKEVDETSISLDTGDTGEDYSFSELMYPYRAMLNKEEQKAYDQIYANAVNYNSSPFAIQASISESQVDGVMAALYNDHPELFWLETQYSYQYGRDQKIYSVTLEFNQTIADITANVAQFNQSVNGIITLASAYKSDVEKEKFVHDYLADGITYNESAPIHQSAYSALVNGESVCAGYSRAFQHVMMQMGIPVYYCAGIANGGPHAWNIIKLGNDFYNVDSLWDDSIGEQYNTECYLYFNISDSKFNNEHRRIGLSLNLPACNGTDMSYESAFGEGVMGGILSSYGLSEEDVVYSLKEYYTYCESALTKAGIGQNSFTVVLADKRLYDEIYYDSNQKGYMDGYMKAVAKNLGLTNYSVALRFSFNELPDGHIILTQGTNLISR